MPSRSLRTFRVRHHRSVEELIRLKPALSESLRTIPVRDYRIKNPNCLIAGVIGVAPHLSGAAPSQPLDHEKLLGHGMDPHRDAARLIDDSALPDLGLLIEGYVEGWISDGPISLGRPTSNRVSP